MTLIFFAEWLFYIIRQSKIAKSDAEIMNISNPVLFDDGDKDNEDCILSDQCDDYVPEIKKWKYEKKSESSNDDMPMPKRYCQIKSGERKVCQEIYTIVHLLSSKYHMSKQQIKGSIITIANMLFDRQ